MTTPRLLWDSGTAYDLFISLAMLHDPVRFGLRPAWAAGMRSRLPAAERAFLEMAQTRMLMLPPLHWIHNLPSPKDGATVLWALESLPAAERLPALTLGHSASAERKALLNGVAARQSWTPADEQTLWDTLDRREGVPVPPRRAVPEILGWWARSAEFGERYLVALRAYFAAFFAEEERRIAEVLQQGLAEARLLADRLPFTRLLENLSQGVRFSELPPAAEIVLAPSYWSSPLMFHDYVSADRWLVLFGARPFDASLVPGQRVPDALVLTLKALGDPTRLRILRHLAAGPLTPTRLARRLRLRKPTIIHHLNLLRMAGLVSVMISEGRERAYATREERIEEAYRALREFLHSSDPDDLI